MAKTDYNIGDSVIIRKPGIFQDLDGIILSNNTDTNFKPLSIILSHNLGTWQFSYEDVSFIGKDKIAKEPTETLSEKIAKRAYNKKPKDQPKKEKRKYTKRVKS